MTFSAKGYKARYPMSTPDYELFARLMQNGFQAAVEVNRHYQNQVSIRVALTEHTSEPEDEADIAECEATGQVWQAYWYNNSVGSYSWVAGSFEALVSKVLATAENEPDMHSSYSERYPPGWAR